jgi:hypothetical protein
MRGVDHKARAFDDELEADPLVGLDLDDEAVGR